MRVLAWAAAGLILATSSLYATSIVRNAGSPAVVFWIMQRAAKSLKSAMTIFSRRTYACAAVPAATRRPSAASRRSMRATSASSTVASPFKNSPLASRSRSRSSTTTPSCSSTSLHSRASVSSNRLISATRSSNSASLARATMASPASPSRIESTW